MKRRHRRRFARRVADRHALVAKLAQHVSGAAEPDEFASCQHARSLWRECAPPAAATNQTAAGSRAARLAIDGWRDESIQSTPVRRSYRSARREPRLFHVTG